MNQKNIDFLEKMNLGNDEDLSYLIQKSKKDLFFLKRKRNLNFNSSFNEISKEREESFIIQNSYDFNPNEKDKNNNKFQSNGKITHLREKLNQINNGVSECNNKDDFNTKDIINNDRLNLNENTKILNKNNLNKIQNINENKNNLNFKKESYQLTTNLKENESVLLNTNEKKNNANNSNNISKKSINTKIDDNIIKPKKNNLFNVTLIDENDAKFYNNYNSNNNEVKVLKNNKAVYVNSSLLNNYYTYKNLKIVDTVTNVGKNKRSSKYRGVSKNGNQWQVLIMLDKNKSYIRSYSSEYTAARVYDILAIKSKGFKARTNFIYNYEQISKIIEMDIDIKSKNINEIITNLFG